MIAPDDQGRGRRERPWTRGGARSAVIRERAVRAFDTRTERWHAAGLGEAIDRAEARKALRQASVLLPIAIGILIVFANRRQLLPGLGIEVRYATAALLVVVGLGLARSAGKAVAPSLLRRMEPSTAGTIGFLIRLVTIAAVVLGALAIAGVEPATLAVGGAVTAVVLGLAAQQTLGNVIAGAMLLSTRPFRVADRIRLQGGMLAGQLEGTVASLGLFYTTLLSGGDRVMIPNSTMMQVAISPLTDPDSVSFTARFDSAAVTPADLQMTLDEAISVPLRRPPRIELEEIDAAERLTLRITATPIAAEDGATLATEVLGAIRAGGGEGETDGRGVPAVRPASDGEA